MLANGQSYDISITSRWRVTVSDGIGNIFYEQRKIFEYSLIKWK